MLAGSVTGARITQKSLKYFANVAHGSSGG